MNSTLKYVLVFAGILAFIVAAVGVSSLIIMLIWNGLASYFGFMQIEYWVAILICLALWIVGAQFGGKK